MCCVVVCKLGKGEEFDPVVLLMIDIYVKILFQDLIDVGLGPNSISNLARKLDLVVYLMGSSVSVNTILMNICYLFNEIRKN